MTSLYQQLNPTVNQQMTNIANNSQLANVKQVMTQAKQMANMINGMKNPTQMVVNMINQNPNSVNVLNELKESGMTPQEFFMQKVKSMGLNPQDFRGML